MQESQSIINIMAIKIQKIKILIVIDQHIKTIKIQNIIKQSILKFML